jgi:hypothetical protein
VQLETFDGADLAALFPDLSAGQVARMRAAARGVEAARSRDDVFRWDWFGENLPKDPVDKGVQLVVVGTTLTLFNNLSDWLELALCVVREQRPRLTVSATIEVACWCDPDHNMHVLRREEWLVGTATALTATFESAAAAVVRWAGESHDPLVHRAAAGLPNPEPR